MEWEVELPVVMQNVTDDFVIQKNEILPIDEITHKLVSSNTSVKVLKSHFNTKHIQCYKGPEFDLLNDTQKQLIFNNT